MSDQYILNGKKPIRCNSIDKWAKWFGSSDRLVKKSTHGDAVVSTVFLGLDHGIGGQGTKPLLFETMVFGGKYDEECERYTTWDEAVEGHKNMVKKVKLA